MWQFDALNYSSSPNPDRNDNRNTPEFARYRKKRRKIILITIPSVLAFLLVFSIIIVAIFGGDFEEEARNAYQFCQSDENYVTVTGTLDQFMYSEDKYGYFVFTLIDTDIETEQNKELTVYSQSSSILRKNNFHRDVTIGKSLITATFAKNGLLGDVPVVEIYMDGKCYLDFETGKTNLLKYIEERYL